MYVLVVYIYTPPSSTHTRTQFLYNIIAGQLSANAEGCLSECFTVCILTVFMEISQSRQSGSTSQQCTLLLDAFPLQDPDSTRKEIDGVMQKQFDAVIVSVIALKKERNNFVVLN